MTTLFACWKRYRRNSPPTPTHSDLAESRLQSRPENFYNGCQLSGVIWEHMAYKLNTSANDEQSGLLREVRDLDDDRELLAKDGLSDKADGDGADGDGTDGDGSDGDGSDGDGDGADGDESDGDGTDGDSGSKRSQ